MFTGITANIVETTLVTSVNIVITLSMSKYIPYLLNIQKSGTNLKVRETLWEVLNNLPLQLLLPCSQTRLMI